MKIVLAAPGLPPDLHGGTERSVQCLASALVDAGADVIVVAGSDRPPPATWREERVRTDGGHSYRALRWHRHDLHYQHWHKSMSAVLGAAFERLLDEERPDLVHVHHWSRLTGDLVVRAARHAVPAVVTLHDLSSTCLVFHRLRPGSLRYCESPFAATNCLACAREHFRPTPWVDDAEESRLFEELRAIRAAELRTARRVFVLCEDQAAALRPHLPAGVRIEVEGLGVDPREPAASRPSLPPPPPLRIASFGGLHPIKGTDRLVDVVCALHREGIPLELHLAGEAGDPAFEAELRRRAAGAPVHFHGPFPDGPLTGHPVARCHVFVSATRARETWNLAADEALELGLPLVLPRFGAFVERLADRPGVLSYAPDDREDLAQRLRALARDPAAVLALCAELPPILAVRPSAADHAARMLRHYQEVCAEGPPPAPSASGSDDALRDFTLRWDRGCRGD